ncbi:hypothetical protein CORC01_12436 [Colletotrichum orchidophilum]|uniref:Uncharacterized protein n=1 Tax=Colletotrichum orchidophilum TaxID=1209926 RepID=A0A1G4ASX2_9PEZI|nr:uncharacterized protein CORC01_12436 [Colletotrichum orchidophilum]OHE92267.1 hypothetical protein CORC01_12436 [Colletotrichum orchidophilum]
MPPVKRAALDSRTSTTDREMRTVPVGTLQYDTKFGLVSFEIPRARIRGQARAILRRWLARVKPFPAHHTGLTVAWASPFTGAEKQTGCVGWTSKPARLWPGQSELGVSTSFIWRLIPTVCNIWNLDGHLSQDRDLNS